MRGLIQKRSYVFLYADKEYLNVGMTPYISINRSECRQEQFRIGNFCSKKAELLQLNRSVPILVLHFLCESKPPFEIPSDSEIPKYHFHLPLYRQPVI